METGMFIVAIVGVIVCVPPCLQSLGFDVRIFGSKPVNNKATLKERRGRWILVLCVASLSLAISCVGLYRIISTKPVENQFVWSDHAPTQQITDCNLANQKVMLDDHEYFNCTFTNVTFVYDGTAPFHLSHSTMSGYALGTDNPSIRWLLG